MHRSINRLKFNQHRLFGLLLLTFLLTTATSQFSDTLLNQTFYPTEKLIHYLKQPIFKGRPYFIELFVDIPDDELESVSIFFKTGGALDFEVIPIKLIRERYQFKYDPKTRTEKSFTYFFVVTTKDFSLYAIPLDDKGKISPNIVFPVDPIKYYDSLGH